MRRECGRERESGKGSDREGETNVKKKHKKELRFYVSCNLTLNYKYLTKVIL